MIVLSFFLLASCKKEDTTPPPATTGGVSVNIKIVQKSTGAILPDNKITNWVVNASLWSLNVGYLFF
jgi:hypothetical protein